MATFTFSAQTVFAVENQEQAVIARNFIDLFTHAAGITPALNVGREEGQVRFVTDSSLKSEAYLLEITPQQILIKASDTKGLLLCSAICPPTSASCHRIGNNRSGMLIGEFRNDHSG